MQKLAPLLSVSLLLSSPARAAGLDCRSANLATGDRAIFTSNFPSAPTGNVDGPGVSFRSLTAGASDGKGVSIPPGNEAPARLNVEYTGGSARFEHFTYGVEIGSNRFAVRPFRLNRLVFDQLSTNVEFSAAVTAADGTVPEPANGGFNAFCRISLF